MSKSIPLHSHLLIKAMAVSAIHFVQKRRSKGRYPPAVGKPNIALQWNNWEGIMTGAGRQAWCSGRLHNIWGIIEVEEEAKGGRCESRDRECVPFERGLLFLLSFRSCLGIVWVWSAPKLFELEVSLLCQGWWLCLKRVSERKLGSHAGIVLVILNSLIDECLSSPR